MLGCCCLVRPFPLWRTSMSLKAWPNTSEWPGDHTIIQSLLGKSLGFTEDQMDHQKSQIPSKARHCLVNDDHRWFPCSSVSSSMPHPCNAEVISTLHSSCEEPTAKSLSELKEWFLLLLCITDVAPLWQIFQHTHTHKVGDRLFPPDLPSPGGNLSVLHWR